jgi:hypothetical protein
MTRPEQPVYVESRVTAAKLKAKLRAFPLGSLHARITKTS